MIGDGEEDGQTPVKKMDVFFRFLSLFLRPIRSSGQTKNNIIGLICRRAQGLPGDAGRWEGKERTWSFPPLSLHLDRGEDG